MFIKPLSARILALVAFTTCAALTGCSNSNAPSSPVAAQTAAVLGGPAPTGQVEIAVQVAEERAAIAAHANARPATQ